MKMTVFLGLKVDPALAAKIDNALARRKAEADPHASSRSAFLRFLLEAGLFLLDDEPPAPQAPPVAVPAEQTPNAPPPMAVPVEPAAPKPAPLWASYPGLKGVRP